MDAALAGARLRLRPILMTSFAFIAGCMPLALASGSGQWPTIMGTGVIGGMLAAGVIAIFLIPAGFCIVERVTHWIRRRNAARNRIQFCDGFKAVPARRHKILKACE